MNGIERLEKRWTQDKALQALSVDEAKRVIDTLALAMYADFESDGDEEAALEAAVVSLPCGWDEIMALEAHAAEAAKGAASFKSAEAVLKYAAEVAGQIPKSVHEQVFVMIVAVVVADRELKKSEAAILSVFGESFGFAQAEAELLYNDALEALGLVEE